MRSRNGSHLNDDGFDYLAGEGRASNQHRDPERRPMAWFPALLWATKLAKGSKAFKFGKAVGKVGINYGLIGARYALRWVPYYGLKWVAMKHAREIGPSRVYRILVREARVRLSDPMKRTLVLSGIRKCIRAPSQAWEILEDVDEFLTDFAIRGRVSAAPTASSSRDSGVVVAQDEQWASSTSRTSAEDDDLREEVRAVVEAMLLVRRRQTVDNSDNSSADR